MLVINFSKIEKNDFSFEMKKIKGRRRLSEGILGKLEILPRYPLKTEGRKKLVVDPLRKKRESEETFNNSIVQSRGSDKK